MFFVYVEYNDMIKIKEIDSFKHHYEIIVGKFLSKIRKTGKNLDFLIEGQYLKFLNFELFFTFISSL